MGGVADQLQRIISNGLRIYHLQISRTGLIASLIPEILKVVICGDELNGVNSKSNVEPSINFFN